MKSKLFTPLIIGSVLSVMALGIARLLLMPEAWISSILALLFFPLVIGGLLARHRSGANPDGTIRVSGKLRAGLVGSGVLLATALSESMIETLGLIPESTDGVGAMFVVALPAAVAVAIDIFSARLESRVEEHQD